MKKVKRIIMIGISYFVLFVKKVFASDMYIPPDGACNVTAFGMPHVQVENVLRGFLIGGIIISLIIVSIVLTIVYYHEKKDKKKENVQEEKYDENLK